MCMAVCFFTLSSAAFLLFLAPRPWKHDEARISGMHNPKPELPPQASMYQGFYPVDPQDLNILGHLNLYL